MPRYFGPYRLSKRVGYVAYELLNELTSVHPVFHIVMFEKFMGVHSYHTNEDIYIKDNLSNEEILVQIVDRQVCKLRT